jgi:UDP-N-acetylmuramoyl-tripeptide--D-alanyl-D-alanine ligase
LEEVQGSGRLLVNDAYNANPISMRTFLDAMDSYAKRNLSVCVILGEMADSGERTAEEHTTLALDARGRFESLILIGSTFCRLGYDAVDWCLCLEDLEQVRHEGVIASVLAKHDVVGVKGSYCTHLLSLAADIRKRLTKGL